MRHYRLSLDTREYCIEEADGCEYISRIYAVKPEAIFLTGDNPYSLPSSVSAKIKIDRVNGNLVRYQNNKDGTVSEEVTGKCEMKPFSGFPSQTRKF